MRLGVLWCVCCWHGVMYLKYDLRFVYLDARVGHWCWHQPGASPLKDMNVK